MEQLKKRWIKSLGTWYLIDENDPEYKFGLDYAEHEQRIQEERRKQYLGK